MLGSLCKYGTNPRTAQYLGSCDAVWYSDLLDPYLCDPLHRAYPSCGIFCSLADIAGRNDTKLRNYIIIIVITCYYYDYHDYCYCYYYYGDIFTIIIIIYHYQYDITCIYLYNIHIIYIYIIIVMKQCWPRSRFPCRLLYTWDQLPESWAAWKMISALEVDVTYWFPNFMGRHPYKLWMIFFKINFIMPVQLGYCVSFAHVIAQANVTDGFKRVTLGW